MSGSGPPVVDVAPLVAGDRAEAERVAAEIDAACRTHGFLTLVGHGLDPDLLPRLEAEARTFFALDAEEKGHIAMARAGATWRGWFPEGAELTSGVADGKEGLYFGEELGPDDPRVRAGWPLHGPNLFPERPVGLRPAVLAVIDALVPLAQTLLGAMAVGLGQDEGWFRRELTGRPTAMLRVFRYPAGTGGWGVGEHTDYGLLTLLHQDGTGGLEVRGPDGWREVPPEPGALVCNLGDMLELLTGGRYRSTPHRVRRPDADRISVPFFLDPGFDAEVRSLPVPAGDRLRARTGDDGGVARWDGRDVHQVTGPYGDYLLAKVSRVFPELFADRVGTRGAGWARGGD